MKKKHKGGGVHINLVYDLEDKTLMDYMWIGDDKPPLIKPNIKQTDAEKKRRPS